MINTFHALLSFPSTLGWSSSFSTPQCEVLQATFNTVKIKQLMKPVCVCFFFSCCQSTLNWTVGVNKGHVTAVLCLHWLTNDGEQRIFRPSWPHRATLVLIFIEIAFGLDFFFLNCQNSAETWCVVNKDLYLGTLLKMRWCISRGNPEPLEIT